MFSRVSTHAQRAGEGGEGGVESRQVMQHLSEAYVICLLFDNMLLQMWVCVALQYFFLARIMPTTL